MKFILGKKKEMTEFFDETSGKMVATTIISAEPCYVTQIKTIPRDGYSAIQIACGRRRSLKKPLQGHLKKLPVNRYVKEFRLADDQEVSLFAVGDKITCLQFHVGDRLKVAGVTKGKGFQGVVKRHGFSGSPKSHGHKDQLRMPGSIGATDPGHVFKGKKMPGRMGGNRVTIAHVTVMKIEPEKNLLFIKGALPGPIHTLVEITADGEMRAERDTSELRDKKMLKSKENSYQAKTLTADVFKHT